MKSDAVVGIILDADGRFLLQKKDSGHLYFPNRWCLFGGQIEDSDTPEQTFHREMNEELGGKISSIKFLFEHGFSVETPNGRLEGTLHCFKAKYSGKVSEIRVTEGAGFAFLEWGELAAHPIHPPDMEVLRRYYSLFQ